jgi:hypothetical protein
MIGPDRKTDEERADTYLIAQLQEFNDVERLPNGVLRFHGIGQGPHKSGPTT